MNKSLEALIADTKAAIAKRKVMPGFGPDTSIERLRIINDTKEYFTPEKVEVLIAALEQAQLLLSQQQSIATNNLDMFRLADKRIAELEQTTPHHNGMMQLSNELAELKRKQADLVMLVKVLSRTVKKYNHDSDLAKRATDYLKNSGLINITDCLRGTVEGGER